MILGSDTVARATRAVGHRSGTARSVLDPGDVPEPSKAIRAIHVVPALFFLLWMVPACDRTSPGSQTALHGQTMGTTYTVKLVPELGDASQEKAVHAAVDEELGAVDRAMSTYRTDSELSRFNASLSTDWFDVSPGTAIVVEEALAIGSLSGAAFDVTIEPLVQLWNFGPNPSSVDTIPSAVEIADARQRVGQDRLHARLDPPAIRKDVPELRVDLSSIAKGYAVDCVAGMLERRGYANYMVEVGGEVRVRGHNRSGRSWRIAVERPGDDGPRAVYRSLPLTHRAMATSGDYRNYFDMDQERYSHLIDPRTGKPVTHRLASVTILADRCVRADGLATAMMILGPESGLELAMREGIAATFLIRERTGFTERHSNTFPAPETP